jgi:beta-carotene hydroxylase
MARPALPQSFYAIHTWHTAVLMLYACGLFVLPSVASILLLHSALPVWVKLPLILACATLASFGLTICLYIGHHGGHLGLHRNKYVSLALGIVGSFPISGQFVLGFSASHWNHHGFTNEADDPNQEIYQRFQTFWSRMFLSGACASRRYRQYVWQMAQGQPLQFRYKLPFSTQELQRFARLNLAVHFISRLFFFSLLFLFPWATLIGYFLPLIMCSLYNGVRPYIEHTDTAQDKDNNSRTRSSWVWTLLEAGENFHQEHHLYPRVPIYRLRKLHVYLRDIGYLKPDPPNLDRGILSIFRHAFANATLPVFSNPKTSRTSSTA